MKAYAYPSKISPFCILYVLLGREASITTKHLHLTVLHSEDPHCVFPRRDEKKLF